MQLDLLVLTATAASIAFVHTITGPDHYLPFVAMARAGHWGRMRTVWITALCGLGHVLSSVLLGLVGIALAANVERLAGIESLRGTLAAWGLIAFGLIYGLWGLRRARSRRVHAHVHAHADGTVHHHDHRHRRGHVHVHADRGRVTPWLLFVIFLLGPCEPLIPLVMFPAAHHGAVGVAWVAAVFAVVTLATMLATVLILQRGIRSIRLEALEGYEHAFAGLAILACGLSVQFLGL